MSLLKRLKAIIGGEMESTTIVPAATTMAEDVLRSLTGIPDPTTLLADLRRIQQQRSDADAEWNRLDRNPGDVLRQPVLARQMIALGAQEEQLTDAYADATCRREAFGRLDARFDAVVAEERRLVEEALNHPAADKAERGRQLTQVFDVSRLRARLALHLAAVSNHRKFRDKPDALQVLHAELTARLREIEDARGYPGDKHRKFAIPAADVELVATLEGRSNTKEIRHARS